jgi:membrane protein YqaA with SNARE-associated domain
VSYWLDPTMKFLAPLLYFVVGLGYFAPLAMGILDSSFLVLPFGNDLLVVILVAHHHGGAAWFVLAAACGSTCGVFLLSLVARKLGETGVRALAGEKRYKKLKERIGDRAGATIVVGCLAPPPFPFTVAIAGVAAVDYPIWKILTFTFFARAIRFTVLAILAVKFGKAVMSIVKSSPFEWAMIVFIALCAIASGYSIWQWLHKTRGKQK